MCAYRSRWNGKTAKQDGYVFSPLGVTVDNRVGRRERLAHTTVLQNLKHPLRKPWHAPK